jgi:hypothetical protein
VKYLRKVKSKNKCWDGSSLQPPFIKLFTGIPKQQENLTPVEFFFKHNKAHKNKSPCQCTYTSISALAAVNSRRSLQPRNGLCTFITVPMIPFCSSIPLKDNYCNQAHTTDLNYKRSLVNTQNKTRNMIK